LGTAATVRICDAVDVEEVVTGTVSGGVGAEPYADDMGGFSTADMRRRVKGEGRDEDEDQDADADAWLRPTKATKGEVGGENAIVVVVVVMVMVVRVRVRVRVERAAATKAATADCNGAIVTFF